MTVKELIEKLQQEDPNRIVVMSKDSEGNGFEELRVLDRMAYDSECGEIGLEELTEEDEEQGYEEEDVMEGGVPALVLWP